MTYIAPSDINDFLGIDLQTNGLPDLIIG